MQMKPQPLRRKQPRRFVAKTFYLPIPLAQEIEDRAANQYGGNQSALVTEKLGEGLGVKAPEEALEKV